MAKSQFYQPDTNLSMFPDMGYFLGAPKYPNAMDQVQAGKNYQNVNADLEYKKQQRELGESLDPETDLNTLASKYKQLALKSGKPEDFVQLDQFDYKKGRQADEDEKAELERLNKVINIAEKNPSVALKAAGKYGLDISPEEILSTFERKHAKKEGKADKPKKEFLYDSSGQGSWYDANSLTVEELNQRGLSKSKPKEDDAEALKKLAGLGGSPTPTPDAKPGIVSEFMSGMFGGGSPTPPPAPTPTPPPAQSPLAGAQRDDRPPPGLSLEQFKQWKRSRGL